MLLGATDASQSDAQNTRWSRWTRRRLLRAGGFAGVAATLLAACGPPTPAQPAAGGAPSPPPTAAAVSKPAGSSGLKDGGTFRFSIWTEDPPSLDPYLNVSFRSQEFAAFFYSRLLMSKKAPGVAAQAYVLEGDLAESWRFADDGRSVTFNLRPDARWQNRPPLNGRPVIAQDVVWSFERLMKVSAQKSTFDQVADVSAPDARTVVFRLKDVYVPFEAAIAAPIFWIMPREIIEQDGDATKRVIGSGPFIFDKFDSGIAFTARKNPDYYRKGEPHVDEIVGLTIPDDSTAMAGLRAREIDFYQVAQQNVDSLKKTNPEIQLIDWEYLFIPFVYWKLDKPPFNDVRVRQAVSMALDRDGLINTIFNGRGNWNNFIPWALSEWWLDPRGPDMGPNARVYKHDPAETRRLLSAAGYPNGLKVDLLSTPGYGQIWVQIVEVVLQDLKAAGIDATLKMQDYTAYLATTFKGQFDGGDVMVFGLETPFSEPHDYLFNMYHPDGTRNHAGVNDATLTAMIEQQMRTLDRAERKKQIYDIQRYLAEQMYYPPHATSMRTAAVAPNVRDFYPRSDYGFGAEIVPKLWLDT